MESEERPSSRGDFCPVRYPARRRQGMQDPFVKTRTNSTSWFLQRLSLTKTNSSDRRSAAYLIGDINHQVIIALLLITFLPLK